MDTNTILIIFLVIVLLIMIFKTHVTVIDNQPVQPVPVHVPIKSIGGCAGTRYGCCPNGVTARVNPLGSNC
jgi:hypothetical protein